MINVTWEEIIVSYAELQDVCKIDLNTTQVRTDEQGINFHLEDETWIAYIRVEDGRFWLDEQYRKEGSRT